MWKVQFEFSTLWKLQCRFSTMWKEWLKIFRKTGRKIFYVQQCAKRTLCHSKKVKIRHNLLCKKCRKSRYFCGRILGRMGGRFMQYSMSVVWSFIVLHHPVFSCMVLYGLKACLVQIILYNLVWVLFVPVQSCPV